MKTLSVLLQQAAIAERSLRGVRNIACHDGSKSSAKERELILTQCAEMQAHLDAIRGAVAGQECPADPLADEFCKLLEFLYEAAPSQRYRIANLYEAAHHLELRTLLLEDEAVARNLAAFNTLCSTRQNVVMRNGLSLKKTLLKDHAEYHVESVRVTEAAGQKGAVAA